MTLSPTIFIDQKPQSSLGFLLSIILPNTLAMKTPDWISDTPPESVWTSSILVHSLAASHLDTSTSRLSLWMPPLLWDLSVFSTTVGSVCLLHYCGICLSSPLLWDPLFHSTCLLRPQIRNFHRLFEVCQRRSKLLFLASQTLPNLAQTYLASLSFPQKMALWAF